MQYRKSIFCCLFALGTLLCTQAQTVLKDKKRGAASFEITIRNKPYKQFIPSYLLQHASYKQWQQNAKAACQGAGKGHPQQAKIKILVSVSHKGEVFVHDHYSSPSLAEWINDPTLTELVQQMANDLELLIKQQGKVKPPYDKHSKKYFNDETVVELVWEHVCK